MNSIFIIQWNCAPHVRLYYVSSGKGTEDFCTFPYDAKKYYDKKVAITEIVELTSKYGGINIHDIEVVNINNCGGG